MAEVQLVKIKSLYGDIKGMLTNMPPQENPYIDGFNVEMFNGVIDQLGDVSNTDYSQYKIPLAQRQPGGVYRNSLVRTQVGRVVSRLEEEYGLGKKGDNQRSPNIAIFNKNQNEISLQINYTVNDLIEETSDEEAKSQLRILRDELDMDRKNWDKIKSVLLWILNFSKELFLKVLPLILKADI